MLVLLAVAVLLLSAPSIAQQGSSSITGSIRDAETGAPVAYVQIYLEEAARATQTDENGRFILVNLTGGSDRLHAFRIGYEERHVNVELSGGADEVLNIVMRHEAIHVEEIVVHESRETSDQLGTSAFAMGGGNLRENLGSTIAETLENEPGISMRSMGPAPARPVLRGLGGERLLLLEDGERTGDLSQSSSDHAVAIDPLMTDEIEVILRYFVPVSPKGLRLGVKLARAGHTLLLSERLRRPANANKGPGQLEAEAFGNNEGEWAKQGSNL